MFRFNVTLILSLVAVLALPLVSVGALPPNCTEYVQPGSPSWTYLICLPDANNDTGDLVVYAHGYDAPSADDPVQIPADQLMLGGTSIPDLVTSLGYAFAATSYPKTGLAIKEGVQDVGNLVTFYQTQTGNTPGHVYLAGVSEGGLVATLAIEQNQSSFSGGLALCAPIGDFPGQINHLDDFRTVFDYFFPGQLPPSPVNIPPDVIQNWETTYVPSITAAVTAHPLATAQLLSVTDVPVQLGGAADTVIGLLWYNVFATNQARLELGGQPFDNIKWYHGSLNDLRLNLRIDRFHADAAARQEMKAHYQTSGHLPVPLVTMNNTRDPIVPYWHATLYGWKVLLSGSLGNYFHVPVLRYGHCNFTPAEVLFGFAVLVVILG